MQNGLIVTQWVLVRFSGMYGNPVGLPLYCVTCDLQETEGFWIFGFLVLF
jgi:hypothetical protein